MIEMPARVARIQDGQTWVISEAPSSCGACAGKGCGSSVFNRIWHPENQEYVVENGLGAEPGEAVVIGLEDGALLSASASAYIIPLVAVLTGALLGQWISGEPTAALGGLLGLVLSAIWLKKRPPRASAPSILRLGNPRCSRAID